MQFVQDRKDKQKRRGLEGGLFMSRSNDCTQLPFWYLTRRMSCPSQGDSGGGCKNDEKTHTETFNILLIEPIYKSIEAVPVRFQKLNGSLVDNILFSRKKA